MANSEEVNSYSVAQSVLKLRVGVIFLILFWLPFWLLEPLLSAVLGINTASGRHKLLVIVIIIQTIFGIVGLLLVGKQTIRLLKHTTKRHVIKTLWRMLIHGR